MRAHWLVVIRKGEPGAGLHKFHDHGHASKFVNDWIAKHVLLDGAKPQEAADTQRWPVLMSARSVRGRPDLKALLAATGEAA